MPTLPILAAAGPCAMMVMASIALLIVYHFLSRVRHALIWSAALAAGACQWALTALAPIGAQGEVRLDWLTSIFGLGGLLLFVEGFRLRAIGRALPPWVAFGAVAGVVIAAWAATRPSPLSPLLPDLISVLIYLITAGLVLWRRRRGAVAEATVAAMLAGLAVIHAGQVALMLAAAAGMPGAGAAVGALRLAVAMPAAAAVGLFTMLLIASDFSAERWRLIHTDPLTGVLNRPGFERAARAVLARARPRAHPVSLALADIDRFKAVNDRHGHPAGDAALAAVARRLAGGLRRDDVFGRLGGEEFALLLWSCDGSDALARLDPMRADLAGMPIEGVPDLTVTASFGIAEQHPGERLPQLIARADRALYHSKRAGRDRTTLAENMPEGAG